MRRPLASALLCLALFGGDATGQLLDDDLVPRGQLRLQAHPVFLSWDSRFGRAADGTESEEPLGADLTASSAATLFPGFDALISGVEAMTGTAGYDPMLAPAFGRISQDVTRVEFGGQLGVFDWLTLGVMVPWTQTRSSVDLVFEPDTLAAAELGINPAVAAQPSVDGYLTGLDGAAASALSAAASACSSGPSAQCTSAQALADRASGFSAAARGAYGASPFFPITGSTAATDLAQASAALEADLLAAGLSGIGAPMVFATDPVTRTDLLNMPGTAGAGIEASPLVSRRGLWQTGDIEISALVRLLERSPEPGSGALGYRVLAGGLVRLATGTAKDPDVLLDLGTGDAQQDLEGRVIGGVSWRWLSLTAGLRYGVQQEVTLTRRVAPLEQLFAPLSSRAEVRFSPGGYIQAEAVPALRLTDQLSLTGQLRYFEKKRDEYELVDPTLPLQPAGLEIESGVKLFQAGAGLRYSTVADWQRGIAPRPLEAHLRLVYSVAGGGGHTPVATRVEAGLRLFRRFWGPEPTR